MRSLISIHGGEIISAGARTSCHVYIAGAIFGNAFTYVTTDASKICGIKKIRTVTTEFRHKHIPESITRCLIGVLSWKIGGRGRSRYVCIAVLVYCDAFPRFPTAPAKVSRPVEAESRGTVVETEF